MNKGKQRIMVVSIDAGYGHNCSLVRGLKKYRDVKTVWFKKNKHGLDYIVPDANYGIREVLGETGEIIIVACGTFNILTDYLRIRHHTKISDFLKRFTKVTIIITDSKFAINPDYYNGVFKDYDVFCTPCKIHWRDSLPTREYYQPFDLSGFDRTKTRELTISHSPFVVEKFAEKGTAEITKIVNSLGVSLDVITGLPWKQAMERKAQSHIFIDQISNDNDRKFKNMNGYIWNALGKSGLEGMHLGCMTITRGENRSGQIPSPPVVWVNGNLKETLEKYIFDKFAICELQNKQREWALTYATEDYAARNILGMI